MNGRGFWLALLLAVAVGYSVTELVGAPGGAASELRRRYERELDALDAKARELGDTGIKPPARTTELYATDVPKRYRDAYARATSECRGLRKTWLAAIGKVESNHGRGWPGTGGTSTPGVAYGTENSAGAGGPMQFLAGTWGEYGRGDRWRIEDAAPAAARLLCSAGAPSNMRSALWRYNQSAAYAANVRAWEHRYRTGRFA